MIFPHVILRFHASYFWFVSHIRKIITCFSLSALSPAESPATLTTLHNNHSFPTRSFLLPLSLNNLFLQDHSLPFTTGELRIKYEFPALLKNSSQIQSYGWLGPSSLSSTFFDVFLWPCCLVTPTPCDFGTFSCGQALTPCVSGSFFQANLNSKVTSVRHCYLPNLKQPLGLWALHQFSTVFSTAFAPVSDSQLLHPMSCSSPEIYVFVGCSNLVSLIQNCCLVSRLISGIEWEFHNYFLCELTLSTCLLHISLEHSFKIYIYIYISSRGL